MSNAPLVLASASPRRTEILTQLGIVHRVVPSAVEERRRPEESAVAYVTRLATDKASAVARALAAETPAPFVLGADTVVVSTRGEVLEKPDDDDDARAMLRSLAGEVHEVVTGVAVLRASDADRVLAEAVRTRVTFRPLDDRQIAAYVASGEGRDKAGAYAVQGLGAGLVSSIDGSYLNVVGLPAVEVLELLTRSGALRAWP